MRQRPFGDMGHMSMYHVSGYHPSSYNNAYNNSYNNSNSYSYSSPPQYSSSHSSYSSGPSYGNPSYGQPSYGRGYPQSGYPSYGQDPLMGQVGELISNIIGSIEQQPYGSYGQDSYSYGQDFNYGQDYGYSSYPSYSHNCGCNGSDGYPPFYGPEQGMYPSPYPNQYPNQYPSPYPTPPMPPIYDQYNADFNRPVSQQTGGGTFDSDFTDYHVTDDGGSDRFEIGGYQSKFTFTGDSGPNTFQVRGESNLVKIKNLGADDSVFVYNHDDLIILAEKETNDGHAVALLDPNSGNRIILYSDQPDRGTDFLLDRLKDDYYTGLLSEDELNG